MAAVSIMPSMAMFTTPARSHRMPLKAPMVSGTERMNMMRSMPARLSRPPDAAQVRKAKTNMPPIKAKASPVSLRKPRTSW